MSNEFKKKLQHLRHLIKARSLKGILLSTRANFSWLTCGSSNHVRQSSDKGVASLWVTSNQVELWTNTIEEIRFRTEETKGLPLQYRAHPWWRDEKKSWFPSGKIGSDDGAYDTLNIMNEIAPLRWSLASEEAARYRKVGKLAGEAMSEAAHLVRKGWTEQKASAELSRSMVARGLEPVVLLVGADERLSRYRHPIPKPNKIKKIVMLVICARAYGLIANVTRVIHFGKIPDSLRKKHQSCLRVECAMWNATKPGVQMRDAFQAGVREYIRQGYPGEWEKHHQGGPTGYEPREFLANLGEKRKIQKNQAMAWNPSITGTKTEDTILVGDKGLEVLTATPRWPMVKMNFGGKTYLRPDILEVK